MVELVEPDTLLFVKKGDVALVARIMRDVGERGDGATVHLELPPEQLHFFAAVHRRAPVSALLHVVPLGIAALCWLTLHRLNRVKGMVQDRRADLLGRDRLVLIFLVWLRWF